MCGVNGIFAYHYAANPVDEAELLRTRDYMAARGPDAAANWISPDRRVAFGHRRLAIIDLSEGGAQPMASEDGRLVVTFNGEIYNFEELRADLIAQGRRFRSASDTEVLLHLYAVKGPAMVHDLRGMFAFAIWDDAKREMFLARDPYGIKPLYFSDDGWTFRFASQVKALRAGGRISNDPDPAGYIGFYSFGSIPEPYTTFRAIRALPAGATMTVNRLGAQEPRIYHSVAQTFVDAEQSASAPTMDAAAASEAYRAALRDSVHHHLVADVPVGAFLSAGIDSTALVGMMRDLGQKDIQTVTLTFEEFRGGPDDEAPLAAEIARLYGASHSTRVVSEAEFAADLPRILQAMDQPSIDGINSWFVSKAAHELGLKVAISGLGGDELFGGYPSFVDIPRWVRSFGLLARAPFVGNLARHVGRPVIDTLGANPKAAGVLEYGGNYAGSYLLRRGLFMPWELPDVLDRDMLAAGLRQLDIVRHIDQVLRPRPASSFACVVALESAFYMRNQLLRDTDWASMAHSLEVRTPLVDSTLLAKVAATLSASADAPSKANLAMAPMKPLPTSIRERAKTGFSTPVATWQQRLFSDGLKTQRVAKSNDPWARAWARAIIDRTGASKGTLAA